MNKKIVVPLIFVVFILTLLIVPNLGQGISAQNPLIAPSKLEETRGGQQIIKDQRKETGEQSTRQAQLRQRVIERIKKVFEKILNRFQAALNRLDKISEKIQSRINKLKDKGVDVANVQSMLDSCGAKRSAAEAAIADAKSEVNAIDPGSSTVKQAVKTAVSAIHSVKKAIFNYHKCLVDVTRSLKATSKEASGEAD